MSFFSDQANQFQQMAQAIQTRLTNDGAQMSDTEFGLFEKQRDQLLDKATAMVDADIQATLDQLNLDKAKLAACTADLLQAVKNARTVEKLAAIVGASVTMATAIASANPTSIITASFGAEKAIADALSKPKEMPVTKPAAAGKAAVDGGLAIAASEDSEK